MSRLSPRTLTLLICLACVATGGLAQTPLSGDEARAMVDFEDMEATLARLESARAERGLDDAAQATLAALYVETGQAQQAFDLLEPLSLRDDAPAAVLYNAWRAAALLGQGQERIQLLQRAAQLEPVSPAGRLLGLMLGQRGAYADSLKLLAPWARANPGDAEVRIAAAAAALQLGRAPDAEEMLADLPQDNPRVRLLWGKLLLEQGDPYGALATLKALPSDINPALDADRRRTMAGAYTISGQAAEAVALLEGRVNNDPGIALQLSHAQFKSGNVADAALTLKPFADAVLAQDDGVGSKLGASMTLEYGQLLNSLGRAAEALPYLERSSKLDPGNKLVWQHLGQSLNAAGQRDEARAALVRFQEMTESEVPAVAKEMVLRVDAADPTGRNLRDALKVLANDDAVEALRLVREEAELSPTDIRPRLVEARILAGLNLMDEALVAAEQAVSLDSANADALYQRGAVRMGRQEVDLAEADFRASLSLSADHVATMNDLAVLLMVQDRNDEAKSLLERVLEINPKNFLAADNLAQLNAGG